MLSKNSNHIPYGKQDITQDDINSVVDVLKSNFLTQGPVVPAFEHGIAAYVNANYAVTANSATSALHLACLALDLGHEDILWTSDITFVASANCGRYCDAQIEFVDIDLTTYNICPQKLSEKLIEAKKKKKLPKILIAVHMAGQSCDMLAIHELSKHYGFKVIEDASHAIGGTHLGQKIGACVYSEMTVFSFHPVKVITAAEGGCITTNNFALANKVQQLRSHGIVRDDFTGPTTLMGPMYYEQQNLGFNYRLSDLHAALGKSQLSRVDDYVTRRNRIAEIYNSTLSHEINKPHIAKESLSAFHLYIVRFPDHSVNIRDKVYKTLYENKIHANVHYIPLHFHPYYIDQQNDSPNFQNAELYYRTALSLPIFPNLTDKNVGEIASLINSVIK